MILSSSGKSVPLYHTSLTRPLSTQGTDAPNELPQVLCFRRCRGVNPFSFKQGLRFCLALIPSLLSHLHPLPNDISSTTRLILKDGTILPSLYLGGEMKYVARDFVSNEGVYVQTCTCELITVTKGNY